MHGSVRQLIIASGLLWASLSACFAANCPDESRTLQRDSLRVATLNVAHGRKDARNQVFLREATIRENLLELGRLMDRADADVVAARLRADKFKPYIIKQ